MAPTNRETIRLLCKSIINRLENQKAITFPPRLRQVVQDELYDLVGPYMLTSEDLHRRTLERMGMKAEALEDSQFAESEQYKAARSVIRKGFGDDELHGIFFQKPLKFVAESVAGYMMRSSHIEDVFESDEDLTRAVVEVVQKFNPANLH